VPASIEFSPSKKPYDIVLREAVSANSESVPVGGVELCDLP